MIQARIKGKEAALEETKRRSAALDALNEQIEDKIQGISATYTKTQTYDSPLWKSRRVNTVHC